MWRRVLPSGCNRRAERTRGQACGERIQNLRAAFNWREGLKPADFNIHPRLEGKGGLTCFWQVSGRSNVQFEDWVRHYHCSLLLICQFTESH